MASKTESPKLVKPDVNDIELVFGVEKEPAAIGQDEHMVLNEINNEKNSKDSRPSREMLAAHKPLLKPGNGRQLPPLAGSETDDQDEDTAISNVFNKGTDVGFLNGDKHSNEDGFHKDFDGNHHMMHEDGVGTDGNLLGGGWDEADGLESRFGEVSPMPQIITPDVNVYQQKKIIAQGMMDLALLSANANQLRVVIETAGIHPYFYPSVIFISISIACQIAVGVGLIMNCKYDVKDAKEICKADTINNYTVLGIFIITIVNVFITSFSSPAAAMSTPPTIVNTG